MIGSFPKYKKRNLSQKTLIHKKPKPSNGLTYVTHAFMTQFRTARAQFRLAFACSASFRGQGRNRLLVKTLNPYASRKAIKKAKKQRLSN